MNKEKLEKQLSKFKGSKNSFPFGPEAMVFKVMGKMFALVSQNEEIPRITLKCVPEKGLGLVEQYESVIPGYYMNKRHWITITLNDELSEETIMTLAKDSYNLVVMKLTKADKVKLADL